MSTLDSEPITHFTPKIQKPQLLARAQRVPAKPYRHTSATAQLILAFATIMCSMIRIILSSIGLCSPFYLFC